MASFSAELRVSGASYPLTHCTFGVHQDTYQRGQTSAKVRHGLVQLTLDVPADDGLLVWAATPDKRQAAAVVFRNAAGGQTMETLALAGAYCVAYAEKFVAGAAGGGAYQAFVTLSDPEGFTLQAGGPLSAFVAPAAREHGLPGLERESSDGDIGSTLLSIAATSLGGSLPSLVRDCIHVDEPEAFRNAVIADLEKIHATPTGKELLASLANSGKKVSILYSMGNNSMLAYDTPAGRFRQADGAEGVGTGSEIGYNPAKEYISDNEWGTRPAAIGLAHELVHAEQAAYGRMSTAKADNDGRMDGGNPAKPVQEDVRELEAVGVPPQDEYPFSENKIRAEWNPPQPERKWY